MSMFASFIRQCGFPLCLIGLVALGAWLIHHQAWEGGKAEANAAWQATWDNEQSRLSEAKAAAEAEQRAIEQARQREANEAAENGQKKIDAANDARASALASAAGVRREAAAVIDRLVASQSRLSACTTAASEAATRSARVLADVLGRADERAGSLAYIADQARARGLTCEATYDGLTAKPSIGVNSK